ATPHAAGRGPRVPLGVAEDGDLAAVHAAAQVADGHAQLGDGALGRVRLAGHPQTGFVLLDASLEVGDEGVREILRRAVEVTDVIAPAQVCDCFESAGGERVGAGGHPGVPPGGCATVHPAAASHAF